MTLDAPLLPWTYYSKWAMKYFTVMCWDMKKTKPNVNDPVTKDSFKYGCQIVSAVMYQSSIWVTKMGMNRSFSSIPIALDKMVWFEVIFKVQKEKQVFIFS